MLSPAASVDDFSAAYEGRYSVGRGWVHFCAHGGLFGIVFFGRPGGDDVERLVRSLKVELQPNVAPHRSLVDARRLEGVDAGAFQSLYRYVREQSAALRRQVTQLALVRPEGLQGAVVAGFYSVLDPPYPVKIFADPRGGLEWLGEKTEPIAGELDAIVAGLIGQSPTVAGMRSCRVAKPPTNRPPRPPNLHGPFTPASANPQIPPPGGTMRAGRPRRS